MNVLFCESADMLEKAQFQNSQVSYGTQHDDGDFQSIVTCMLLIMVCKSVWIIHRQRPCCNAEIPEITCPIKQYQIFIAKT